MLYFNYRSFSKKNSVETKKRAPSFILKIKSFTYCGQASVGPQWWLGMGLPVLGLIATVPPEATLTNKKLANVYLSICFMFLTFILVIF